MMQFQVYVLQDTELMKFVFDQDPTSTQKRLPDFKAALETALRPQPLRFNLYDTEFYSQVDGSLDFGRTRYDTRNMVRKRHLLLDIFCEISFDDKGDSS